MNTQTERADDYDRDESGNDATLNDGGDPYALTKRARMVVIERGSKRNHLRSRLDFSGHW